MTHKCISFCGIGCFFPVPKIYFFEQTVPKNIRRTDSELLESDFSHLAKKNQRLWADLRNS
jgi:hypothetical protein